MENIKVIVSISLLSLSTLCVQADTLTGNGSLQSWNSSVLGTVASPTTGGPYWNNLSGDGPAYNVGWCMTGTGNCAISNPPGAVNYYGNGTAAASNIGFTGAGTFAPTTTYGFYMENVQTAGLVPPNQADYFWFMNDSLDYASGAGTIDPGVQHFSVFQSTNSYYLGIEDTPAATSDFDYNDMIVQIQPAPEPASIALMAGGMGLLGWAIRRRRA
jgi:hypothetical protein